MQAPGAPAAQLCAAGSAAAGQEQASQQQPQSVPSSGVPNDGSAQQHARQLAPGLVATAAAGGGPQQQPPAAGPAAVHAGPTLEEDADADGEAAAEGEEYDEELGVWLAGRLQRLQPGAELTVGSVKVLGKLLDEVTVRVLEEAQRVSAGDATVSSSCPAADAVPAGTAAVSAPAPGSVAAAVAQAVAAGSERRSKQAQAKASALTSLDIHKALKRVLPGEPSDNKLRPYLPAVTKQAWHLDKQSLKGIKRQKQAAGAAGPAAGVTAAAAELAAIGPTGDQLQPPAPGAGSAAKENMPAF